jgi:hypothetical protein
MYIITGYQLKNVGVQIKFFEGQNSNYELLAQIVKVKLNLKATRFTFIEGENSNYRLSVQIVGVKLNLKAQICQANSNGIFEGQSLNTGYPLKLSKSSNFEGYNCQASKFKHINQLFKRSKINTLIGPFILRGSIKAYKVMKQSNKRKQSKCYNIMASKSLV